MMTERPAGETNAGFFSIPLPIWGGLIGTLLLRVASSTSGALMSPILASGHLPSVGATATLLATLTVAFYLAELTTAPFFGVLSDRWGRRRYMQIGVGCGIAALILLIAGLYFDRSLMPPPTLTFAILFLIFFLKGFSTASSTPATLGYIAETTSDDPARRGRVIGVYEVVTAGGLLGGAVLADFLWGRFQTDALYVSFATYILAALAFSLIRERPQRLAAAHSVSESTAAMRNTHLLRFAPAWLAVNAVTGLWLTHARLQAYLPADAGQLLAGGFTPNRIAMGVGGYGLIFGLGMLFWGWQLGRIKKTTLMLIATGAGLVETVVMFALNRTARGEFAQIVILVAIVAVATFILAGFTPAALAYLADLSEENPRHRGAVMGAYSVLLGVGQLFGAGLGGPLADRWRFDGLIIGTVALLVAAGATVIVLRRYDQALEARMLSQEQPIK